MNVPTSYFLDRHLRFPVCRPHLPAAEQLLPYLQMIDDNRWYSNHGPLLQWFEQRLAVHFSLPPGSVIATSNCTESITLALRAVGAQPGSRCLVPSFTFVASAAAVHAAGLVPHFVDVDAATWQPDPAQIIRRTDLETVGAIIVVSPFGGMVDYAAWEDVSAVTGIPVIIDGAAAFDTLASAPYFGNLPVAVSLHATKPLGIGEGGLVLVQNPDMQEKIRRLGNFGFLGFPEAAELGWNAKMSEYHAAVGLAALDGWHTKREVLAGLMESYTQELNAVLPLTPGFGSSWVASTACVVLPVEAEQMACVLRAHGIETRRWWRSGVHAMSAYKHLPADPLPVTTGLAHSLLGLPLHTDLDCAAIKEICSTLLSELSKCKAIS